MSTTKKIYKVTGELQRDRLEFTVSPWKLLIETSRYYEIKPNHGAVKRLYKEKLNVTTNETKFYANGILSVSAFCSEESIHEVQKEIVKQLKCSISEYMNDLELNRKAIHYLTVNLEVGRES